MPYINMHRWIDEYAKNLPPVYQRYAYFYYFELVAGYPLSQMLSGRTYTRVRNILFSQNLAGISREYCPYRNLPRIFPTGELIVFDIYTKDKYEYKRVDYTFQLRFRVWFPHGFFLPTVKLEEQLYSLFKPIGDDLMMRINFGASLPENVRYTVGIVERQPYALLENRATWQILITKFTTTSVHQYAYNFLVDYDYNALFTDADVYVDMCKIHILQAKSCRTGLKLYNMVNETYREYYGVDYPRDQYYYIFNRCYHEWSVRRPMLSTVCGITERCPKSE